MKKNKFGRHQTVHPTLKQKIDDIGQIPGVSRVIIGPSRGGRHNKPVGSVKLQADVGNAVRMVGYSDRGISEFYVITSDPVGVRQQITKLFKLDEG